MHIKEAFSDVSIMLRETSGEFTYLCDIRQEHCEDIESHKSSCLRGRWSYLARWKLEKSPLWASYPIIEQQQDGNVYHKEEAILLAKSLLDSN